MSTDTLICRDLYVKTTEKTGKSHITSHRVWGADGAERFMAAQQASHDKADDGKPDGARISMATREQYLKEKAPCA